MVISLPFRNLVCFCLCYSDLVLKPLNSPWEVIIVYYYDLEILHKIYNLLLIINVRKKDWYDFSQGVVV